MTPELLKKLKPRQRALLRAYVQTGRISVAARAAKMDRAAHYHWLHHDENYVRAWEVACVMAAENLEDEAVRRAYEGVPEPVVFQGNFTYPHKNDDGSPDLDRPLCVRKYSDTLLALLLKGKKPEVYRDKQDIALSTPNGIQTDAKIEVVFRRPGDPQE